MADRVSVVPSPQLTLMLVTAVGLETPRACPDEYSTHLVPFILIRERTVGTCVCHVEEVDSSDDPEEISRRRHVDCWREGICVDVVKGLKTLGQETV